MRRSVENAEHVGLFRHSSWKHRKSLRATTTHVQSRQNLLPAFGLRSAASTMLNTHDPNDPFSGIASSSYINQITKNLHMTNTNVLISTGLFAPRQGQMYREEQRRRRSQYDRGTPGAEFEAHTQYLTDPALSAYPPQSYSAPTNASNYVNIPYAASTPGPSTWYLHDY